MTSANSSTAMLAEVRRRRPDPIFILDIGELSRSVRPVEPNSFSSSWLYQCDMASVAAEATEFAAKAWEKGDA